MEVKSMSWCLGYRRRTSDLSYTADPANYTLVVPPPGISYADPFPFEWNGRTYIFFENFRENDYFSGVISVLEVLDDHTWTQPETVLRAPYHISYPFVFSDGDTIFMLPETRLNKTIELYKSVNFPTQWSLEKVLLPEIEAVDSTLLQHADGLYLFTWVYQSPRFTELQLFESTSLTSQWKLHSANPLRRKISGGRPAGKFFVQDGCLYRPSQYSAKYYGEEVVINEVKALNATAYKEKQRGRIRRRGGSDVGGVHTYNRCTRYEVIDFWSF